MILSQSRLVELSRKLDDVRVSADAESELYCKKEYGDGREEKVDGSSVYKKQLEKGKVKPHVHGRAHLGIDVKSGKVICMKCAE